MIDAEEDNYVKGNLMTGYLLYSKDKTAGPCMLQNLFKNSKYK